MNNFCRCIPSLGTLVEINLTGGFIDSDLIDFSQQAFALLQNINNEFSFHRLGSELSQFNLASVGETIPLSEDFRSMLEFAMQLSERTQGIYDLTVARRLVLAGDLPDHGFDLSAKASYQSIILNTEGAVKLAPVIIDLGGLAKGFAVDQAFEFLAAIEGLVVCVNAGGDMRSNNWRAEEVGVRLPSKEALQINMPMLDQALATSANYYYHNDVESIETVMVSPVSGEKVLSELSYSVFADRCLVADALTKVAYLTAGNTEVFSAYNAQAFSLDVEGVLIALGDLEGGGI